MGTGTFSSLREAQNFMLRMNRLGYSTTIQASGKGYLIAYWSSPEDEAIPLRQRRLKFMNGG